MKAAIEAMWYRAEPPPGALILLERLYGALAGMLGRRGRALAQQLPVPVIVVGNITVGGTGKTPFTIWLVEQLRNRGLRPGVVSRGYGGRAAHYPLRVTPASTAAECGDEPLLIAIRSGVPVAVAPNRVDAARALIEADGVDIIVADDGLQHHRLARDLEICVVDGQRGLGNGRGLPAGPLREPARRLGEVDLIVVNGGAWRPEALDTPLIEMRLVADQALSLRDAAPRALASFRGERVHAVAGIGNPQRFFTQLRGLGLDVVEHPFADHHRFAAADLDFRDDQPVLMTEKDAVKCRAFARPGWWAVPVAAEVGAADRARVQQLLERILKS